MRLQRERASIRAGSRIVENAGADRLTQARADYLAKLALNYTRRTAPARYWNHAKCRDGGVWDIFPGVRGLG